jgi:hypothetical protein
MDPDRVTRFGQSQAMAYHGPFHGSLLHVHALKGNAEGSKKLERKWREYSRRRTHEFRSIAGDIIASVLCQSQMVNGETTLMRMVAGLKFIEDEARPCVDSTIEICIPY